jgi:hypothetical protein
VGKKCHDAIEKYRKSGRTPIEKVEAISNIASYLSATAPHLTEGELNDSLGTYLKIIEQHDRSVKAAADSVGTATRSETAGDTPVRSKQAASPGGNEGPSKKAKSDDTDFPWIVRGDLSGCKLSESLETTLTLLRAFARDLKFAKSSIINSGRAPSFPSSEWTNIVSGSMVGLDHVISGSFAISNDNRDVEHVGGMEVKFGTTKPSKTVKTSGDWFIAWGAYSKAAVFVFPHRREEFDEYSQRILGLFAATTPCNHSAIINLDKGIRARVGESRNLLLTDSVAFDELRLYWLNPLGAGGQPSRDMPGKPKKNEYRDDEPCYKWNAGECTKKASDCKHQHVCEICHGKHRKGEHEGMHVDT